MEPALIPCLVCLSVHLSSDVSHDCDGLNKDSCKHTPALLIFPPVAAPQAALLPWLLLKPLLSSHFRANSVLTCGRSERAKPGWMFPSRAGGFLAANPRPSGAFSTRSGRPSYPFCKERQPTSTNTALPAKLWRKCSHTGDVAPAV